MVPSRFNSPPCARLGIDARSYSLDRPWPQKVKGPGHEELLHFLRHGDAGARPQRATIQRRGGVGIAEDVLDLPMGIPQPGRRERSTEDVAGAGTVDAVHLESRRLNLAAAAPAEAA